MGHLYIVQYNLNGVYHKKPCENKLHVTGKWKSQNLNSKAHAYSLKICALYYTKIFYWRQACFFNAVMIMLRVTKEIPTKL